MHCYKMTWGPLNSQYLSSDSEGHVLVVVSHRILLLNGQLQLQRVLVDSRDKDSSQAVAAMAVMLQRTHITTLRCTPQQQRSHVAMPP